MKKLLIPALLLAAASSYGALSTATGGRLTDYTNWFEPFGVASDQNYIGVPYPSTNTPDSTAIDTVNRDWSGWTQNWTPGLTGPLMGTVDGLVVETVFLGETAGWWDDWGYRLNGVDYLLSDGVQTIGWTPNREFGDYLYFTLYAGDTLDFFVTGSGITSQDGAITVGPDGGKYYVFDKSLNTPIADSANSYFGTLTPLTSVRGDEYIGNEDGALPFTVVSFEDQIPSSDLDFNDFLFAFRAGEDIPQGGVPEPSTYGLLGAAALLGLVGYRRFKKQA